MTIPPTADGYMGVFLHTRAIVRSVARLIAGLLLGATFAAFMIYATLGESRAECEVCVDFGGHRACRTGLAADRESAVRGAIASACAVLSRGVTQGIRCDQTPPRSVRCAD